MPGGPDPWAVPSNRWPSLEEVLQFQTSSTPGSFLFFHLAQLNTSSSSSTRAPSPARERLYSPDPPVDDIWDDPLLQDLINNQVKTESSPTQPLSSPPAPLKRKSPDPPVWIILDESDQEEPPLSTPQQPPQEPPSPGNLPQSPPSPLSPPLPSERCPPLPPPSSSKKPPATPHPTASHSDEPPAKRTRSAKQKAWFEGLYGESHRQKFALCKFFASSGSCRAGAACKFSHDLSLPSSVPGMTTNGDLGVRRTIPEPCRFLFAAGPPFECKKGERCPFRHDLESMGCVWREMRVPCARTPCPFNHRGGFLSQASEAEKVEFVRQFRSVLSEGEAKEKLWWHEYLRRDVDELAFI